MMKHLIKWTLKEFNQGKLDSLVDNIETILAVVRDGEKAIVSDISHEI